MMPGHVFVVRGDLTRIACGAWLLPTSWNLWIEDYWLAESRASFTVVPRRSTFFDEARKHHRHVSIFGGQIRTPIDWGQVQARTFQWEGWKPKPGQSRPWRTAMANDGLKQSIAEQASWFAEGARQFVEAAATKLGEEPALNGRCRPLLALPVVGTGAGGGSRVAGTIIRELMRVLHETVQTLDADVAIVTHSGDQFAAVQRARRDLLAEIGVPWALFPKHLRDVGDKLAAHARAGELVLFIGAGVSVGAGLPTWSGLISKLALRAGLSEDDRKALDALHVLDQARIVGDRLSPDQEPKIQQEALAEAISEETRSERYGLTHALLASLPVTESVTTNYDTLFEDASGAAGHKTAVLPYTSVKDTRRWLLKMHGCVDHPEDIVLTREDFLRYADRRGALAGIVQALLITRHMLFVGFSLTDDNFLRIADEVRKVVRMPDAGKDAAHREPFGTALLLSHAQLLPSLWKGDISCVSVSETSVPATDTENEKLAASAKSANELEILLDYVLAESSQNVAHLLDSRYEGLLAPEEVELREALKTLSDVDNEVKALPAWRPIQALLESLGGRHTHNAG